MGSVRNFNDKKGFAVKENCVKSMHFVHRIYLYAFLIIFVIKGDSLINRHEGGCIAFNVTQEEIKLCMLVSLLK
jgi:hypothetical protein